TPDLVLSLLTATPTTYTYTLSLHDALPIFQLRSSSLPLRFHSSPRRPGRRRRPPSRARCIRSAKTPWPRMTASSPATFSKAAARSEEHTSELQSRSDLVCRLLLEKKKTNTK